MRCIPTCLVILLPLVTPLQKDATDVDFTKSVISNGYPLEIHKTETSDGYILTIFRIPHGKNSNVTSPYPVLLNHGMLGSSENFIVLGPKKSLGYVLADNGYDVWIMNARGTWHSKQHRSLKPDQKEFWQFSWHEIGIYDLPAVIDYVLSITKQPDLLLVGHSQGTTSAFVMGSERPEYNRKIKLMVALAPAAFYRYFKHPMLKMAASYDKLLEDLIDSLAIYEFPPKFISAPDLREIFKLLCVESTSLKNTCTTLFFLLSETNPDNFDVNSLQQIFPMVLATCSVKQVFHYAQLINSGNFQQFDWGREKNIEKYGTAYPPLYNVSKITYPTALIIGGGDKLVSEEDVKLLASKLPNVVAFYKVPTSFTHIDFILASNVDEVLNKSILKIMKKYKNKI